jgi:hypothetical protein
VTLVHFGANSLCTKCDRDVFRSAKSSFVVLFFGIVLFGGELRVAGFHSLSPVKTARGCCSYWFYTEDDAECRVLPHRQRLSVRFFCLFFAAFVWLWLLLTFVLWHLQSDHGLDDQPVRARVLCVAWCRVHVWAGDAAHCVAASQSVRRKHSGRQSEGKGRLSLARYPLPRFRRVLDELSAFCACASQ